MKILQSWCSVLMAVGLMQEVLAARRKRAAYDLPDGADLIVGGIQTTFQCPEQQGYYADVANHCKLFHICHPITKPDGTAETQHFTFACGNLTVFNQLTLTCSFPEESIPCGNSPDFFYVNDYTGIPNAPLHTENDIERARPLIPGFSQEIHNRKNEVSSDTGSTDQSVQPQQAFLDANSEEDQGYQPNSDQHQFDQHDNSNQRHDQQHEQHDQQHQQQSHDNNEHLSNAQHHDYNNHDQNQHVNQQQTNDQYDNNQNHQHNSNQNDQQQHYDQHSHQHSQQSNNHDSNNARFGHQQYQYNDQHRENDDNKNDHNQLYSSDVSDQHNNAYQNHKNYYFDDENNYNSRPNTYETTSQFIRRVFP